MRALVWMLVAVVLIAAIAWWFHSGEQPSYDEVSVDETTAPTEERAGLEGMTENAGIRTETLAEMPPGAGALEGTVENTDGEMLEGIRVELHRARENEPRKPGAWLERVGEPEHTFHHVATTPTDARGRFVFGDLPHGSFRVVAVGEDGWFSTSGWGWVSPHSGNKTLRLVLGEGTVLRVRVVDGEGNGLRGYLTAYRERDTTEDAWFPWSLRVTQTDAEGRARITAPSASIRLTIQVPGVGIRRGVLVELPQADEVVLRMDVEDGAVVRGQVTDSAGRPIRGARLLVTSRRGAYDGEYVSKFATTDENGRYRVDGLIDGHLEQIGATAKGYLSMDNAAQPHSLEAGATVVADVTLVRGGIIEGTVMGPGGEAVAGARVEAHATNAQARFTSWDAAESDASGRYRLDAVPLGAGTLRVSARGWYQNRQGGASVAERYEISEEGQTHTLDVVMARGIPLSGRVVDASGAPVENAEVRLTGRNKEGWWRFDDDDRIRVTRSDGRFHFEGVPPSPEWTLRVRTAGAQSEDAKVAGAAGEPLPEPVELVLRRGAIVAGRVLVGGEVPTMRLRVTCRDARQRHIETVQVAPDGKFRLDGLAPADVEVYVVDRNLDNVSNTFRATLEWGTVHQDVTLEAETLGSIAGVVVDSDGNPVGGLQLRLNIETPNSSRSRTAETTRTGRFEFGSLEDSEYAHTISIGNDVQPGTYKPGDTDVRLVYRRPETIIFRGTVRLPDGRPAVSGYVQITETGANVTTTRGAPILEGGFAMRVTPKGEDSTFVARITDVTDKLGRPVNIRPMTIPDVSSGVPIAFELLEGLLVEGAVVDDKGAGVAGVNIHLETKSGHRHGSAVPTRADGTFAIERLGPGTYVLEARAGLPWVRPPAVDVEGGDRGVRIELARATTLEGRVVGPDGKGIAGASVTFYWDKQSARATASSDGAFEVAGVPPGVSGRLDAWPPRQQPNPDALMNARLPEVASGAKDVVVTLPQGVTIEGEVVGPDGEALESVSIYCQTLPEPGQAPQMWLARIEAGETAFVLGPMPPGRYQITAHVVGGEVVSPDPFQIEAPATGVVIRARKGHTVRGVVKSEFDRNRMMVQFVLLTANGPHSHGGGITHAGEFAITMKDETPGTIFIQERNGTRYGLVERVRPSDGPFEVVLREGESLSGHIHEYDAARGGGYVYLQGATGITINAPVKDDGTFRAAGVPPGVYDVIGFTQDGRLEAEHGVAAGAENVVLRKGAK